MHNPESANSSEVDDSSLTLRSGGLSISPLDRVWLLVLGGPGRLGILLSLLLRFEEFRRIFSTTFRIRLMLSRFSNPTHSTLRTGISASLQDTEKVWASVLICSSDNVSVLSDIRSVKDDCSGCVFVFSNEASRSGLVFSRPSSMCPRVCLCLPRRSQSMAHCPGLALMVAQSFMRVNGSPLVSLRSSSSESHRALVKELGPGSFVTPSGDEAASKWYARVVLLIPFIAAVLAKQQSRIASTSADACDCRGCSASFQKAVGGRALFL